MTLTKDQMDAKIDEHFGFEAADDVEGVLATLAEDVEHDVVGWPGGPLHGRNAARHFYETMFSDLANGRVTPLRRLYGDSFLVDESLWEGTAAGRPFGLHGDNRPLRFRLLHVVEFAENEEIAREQVWLDMTAIAAALPQAAAGA